MTRSITNIEELINNHALYISYQDGNGFVSTSEIKYVLTRFLNSKLEASINPLCPRIGLVFTDDELGEMVQEADIDGDQHISFDEFRDIFNEG